MESNIAILIDFENIAAGTEKENLGRFKVEALMSRIKDKGRILIARSYGDWGRFARFKQDLLTNNVTMMELTSHGMQDKNRADIAMVVDCLELAFTRDYVDTYVIVSGDSDFTPLVLKMRELNKKVIGVGTRGSTSRLIINACDEFIFYDSIVKTRQRPKRESNRAVPKTRSKAMEFLVEAVEGLQRENPTPPLASVVKTALLRRRPDFSQSDLGFNSFTRFLESARDAGVVTLERDKKSGGYRVDTVDDLDDSILETEPPASKRSSGGRDRGSKKHVPYADPYYPEGSEALVASLHQGDLGPMAASTRLALLESLCAAVEDRVKKRRRVTIAFVQEDISKRLRRTHAELGGRDIRAVLNVLMGAGQFIHKDGSPIRSANAPFTLDKTAEKLNQTYTESALSALRGLGAELDNVEMLSHFFYGDAERTRDVETTLAWLATQPIPEPPAVEEATEAGEETQEASELDLDALDLDALLVTDDLDADDLFSVEESGSDAPAAVDAPEVADAAPETVEAAPEEEPAAAEPAAAEPAPEPAAAEPAPEPAAEEPEPKPKPKRKRRTRKKAPAKEEAVEATAPADAEAPAPVEPDATAEAAEPEPKPKRKRTRRKKAEPKPEVQEAPAASDDLDAVLELD